MRSTARKFTVLLAPVLGVTVALALTGCTDHTTRIQINGKTIIVDGIGNGNRAQDTVQQRVRADRVERLDIDTTAGNIEIRPGSDEDLILIRATRTVTGRQSVKELQTYLAKVTVTQRLVGDTLEVRCDVATGALPEGVGHDVGYVVTVPKRLAVDLKSVSGDISVNDLRGGVKAITSSGGIELKSVAGHLDLQTVSGDVLVQDAPDADGVTIATASGALELKNIAGRFAARSTSGDITLEGGKITASLQAESSSGELKFSGVRAAGNGLDLNLRTVSGDITYNGDADKIEAHTSSGSLEIDATDAFTLSEVNAESISGSLALHLPALTSARITAHTVSGELELPQSGGDSADDDGDRDHHTATLILGGGQTPVTLNTSSGDIKLTVGD